MNRKQYRTLAAIFTSPVPKNLAWDDIESLFKAIGCEVIEGKGSRVAFKYRTFQGDTLLAEHRSDFHRPHPQKEAKPHQVRAAKEFLEKIGLNP